MPGGTPRDARGQWQLGSCLQAPLCARKGLQGCWGSPGPAWPWLCSPVRQILHSQDQGALAVETEKLHGNPGPRAMGTPKHRDSYMGNVEGHREGWRSWSGACRQAVSVQCLSTARPSKVLTVLGRQQGRTCSLIQG